MVFLFLIVIYGMNGNYGNYGSYGNYGRTFLQAMGWEMG